MKHLWTLVLLGGTASAQPFPFEKGHGPEWDAGTPIESAYLRCRNCHDRASVPEESIYMPFDGWVSSMMGNAQRDPLFKAAVSVANQDVKDIGQWCNRCHSPQAFLRGHTLPADGGALDDLDREGVTCDICHRSIVQPNEPGAPFIGNAQLYFDTTLNKYGPYPDVFSPAHVGVPSTFSGSSELCGQCHSVHNPLSAWRALDGGTQGPRFPLDTTYEEWKQSSFATTKSCVDCHMPRFTGPDGGTDYRIAKGFNAPRTNPRQHALAGANVWGLEAVKAANPELALEFADQFERTKQLSLQNLRDAATLTLNVPSVPQSGNVAAVTVRVTNLTGHKLPTGYADGRRVVIQLLAGDTVITGGFDAGALLKDNQLRVYEAQHGRVGIGVSEHLALHDAIFKDSRIPPRGMVSQPSIAPVGVSWFNENDGGLRDYDEASFAVPLPASLADGAKLRITARLLYQSTTPEYIEFLATENRTDDAGVHLKEIYEATGQGAPIEMAKAEGELTIARLPDAGPMPRPTDGGTGGSVAGNCNCASGPGAFGFALLTAAALFRARRRR